MSQIDIHFNNSFAAWEEWNLTEVDRRYEKLGRYVASMPDSVISAGKFQLNQTNKVVSKVHQLVGPTGETNELYVAGRGVAVLVVDSTHKNTHRAAVALLVAILSAGNSTILCCDDDTLSQLLVNEVNKEELLSNVVQCLPFNSYKGLLEQDIKNFAYVGSERVEQEINQLLAVRTGAITALISETDLERLPQSQDPKLVLRFITERTRTINITAVGGNATLLELGSGTS